MNGLRGMSLQGWMQLARWTVFGTIGCIMVANAISYLMVRSFDDGPFWRSMLTASIIPIVLAGPLFFYLTLKLRELAIANHMLSEMASVDDLTGALNRRAFTEQVGRLLAEAARRPMRRGEIARGALLVIDADHFKSVNDRFGHDQGDVALRCIADAIRSTIRRDDVLGRLGGEEFAVYLPNATLETACEVAERIRVCVERTPFRPSGVICLLSVSVGGAAYEGRTAFDDLFRRADQRLYEAKSAGRNQIAVSAASGTARPRSPNGA